MASAKREIRRKGWATAKIILYSEKDSDKAVLYYATTSRKTRAVNCDHKIFSELKILLRNLRHRTTFINLLTEGLVTKFFKDSTY